MQSFCHIVLEILVAFALFPQTFYCGFGHINVSGHFNFEDMDKRRLFGMAYAILMTMALTKLKACAPFSIDFWGFKYSIII